MTLAAMIRKRRKSESAKANPANSANEGTRATQPLATLATLALAIPPEQKTSNPADPRIAEEDALVYRWWRIHYQDGEPMEFLYSPPATRAEILEWNPGAVKAEPFEPATRKPTKPLSAYQRIRIRAWLRHIEETDERNINNVIDQCNTDADARSRYLAMAQEALFEKGGRE
jgi:hypothetical protein